MVSSQLQKYLYYEGMSVRIVSLLIVLFLQISYWRALGVLENLQTVLTPIN